MLPFPIEVFPLGRPSSLTEGVTTFNCTVQRIALHVVDFYKMGLD